MSANFRNNPQIAVIIAMLTCLFASGSTVEADTAVPAWLKRYNSPIGSDDRPYHVATDVAGNVVVAGYRYNGFTWNDLVLIKYASFGVPLWTNVYAGSENFASELNALALDSQCNVFIGGFSRIGGSVDFLLLKYSQAGMPLWTNYYDGAAHGTDRIWDLDVDSADNVIVTGAALESGINTDCVTIKYSGAGIPLWTNRNSSGSGYSLVLDSAGNVIVGGDDTMTKFSNVGLPLWTNSSVLFNYGDRLLVDGNDNLLVMAGPRYPYFGSPGNYSIIKYTAAGTPLWTNQFEGPHFLPSLAVHPNGSILAPWSTTNTSNGGYDFFITAISNVGTTLWSTACDGINAITCGADGLIFTAGGNGHVTTAYSSDGLPLWTNRYLGSMGSGGYAAALALAGNDQVVTVGMTYNAQSSENFTTIAHSGSGTALWTNGYDGGAANYSDVAQALVVGVDGSVVVTGSSKRLVGENDDYTTIKYSATGQPHWTNWFSGPASSSDRPIDIALDAAGDVIVTGQTISTNLASTALFATVKISATGTTIWTNYYRFIPSGGSHVPQAIAMGSDNSVYVTGYSHGGSSFYDIATIKYAATGIPQWTNRYNTPLSNSDDRPAGMVVANSGAIYVTGYGPSTLGGTDFITLAYSSTGIALWTNRYHLTGADNRTVDVATDETGNIFVTGYSKLNGQTTYDFATIKYASSGLALWTNRYNGTTNGEDRPVALATDGFGNVVITGYSTNATTGFDIATIKYSGDGLPLWTNTFDGAGHAEDRPVALAINASGEIIVTGISRNGASLATTDFLTVKFSSAGALLWAVTHNGPANDFDSPMSKRSLGVGPGGSVYVTGEVDANLSTGRTYDYATIKYVEVAPIHLQLLPLSNGGLAFAFTNYLNRSFTVLSATNAAAGLLDWEESGAATESPPGQFQYNDNQPATNHQRFYRVRSP